MRKKLFVPLFALLMVFAVAFPVMANTGEPKVATECCVWDEGVFRAINNCWHNGYMLFTCLVCEETKTESYRHMRGCEEFTRRIYGQYQGGGVWTPIPNPQTGRFVWIMSCATPGCQQSKILPHCAFADCDWDEGVFRAKNSCWHNGYFLYTCLDCGDTKEVWHIGQRSCELVRREYGQYNNGVWTPITRWQDGNKVWVMVCTTPGCQTLVYHCYNCEKDIRDCEFDCLVTFVGFSNAMFISILPKNAGNNASVWILSFSVNRVYSDGTIVVAEYAINLNANNANQSGNYTFGECHDLYGYTLTFDIRGNGSSIREFRIR
ncbi:MAG: hypothetical protein FWE21_06550 [Defluviitaleaceae bacterium]|nr:hypothetical protein [Defluviitaleaceae bacterium]